MLNSNPLFDHITKLLEQATPEQLRIIYQVIRGMIRPHGTHDTQLPHQ